MKKMMIYAIALVTVLMGISGPTETHAMGRSFSSNPSWLPPTVVEKCEISEISSEISGEHPNPEFFKGLSVNLVDNSIYVRLADAQNNLTGSALLEANLLRQNPEILKLESKEENVRLEINLASSTGVFEMFQIHFDLENCTNP